MALVSFAGIASGIDSAALIDALIQQKRTARIQPLETKLASLSDTNDALGNVKSLLADLKSAAAKFRTLNGGPLVKQITSSDETVLSGTASGAATSGSYTLTVDQLAKNATFSFNDAISSSSDLVDASLLDGEEDTVTFTVGTGAEQRDIELTVTNQTTFADLVEAFNSDSDASGRATASLVNVGTSGSPSYRFLVSTSNTGEERGNISVSVGATLTGHGVFTSSTTSQATNAEFSISGIDGGTTIERATNSVSDVIEGVTFNLLKTGSATVTVGNDTSASTTLVQDFVDAYNALVEEIHTGDLITRDESGEDVQNIFGPLANTSLDESILSSIRSVFSSISESGGTVNTLADLGVTTNRDGSLSFNVDTFGEALSDDSEGLSSILANLGETLASVSGTIDQFTQFGGLIDQAVHGNSSEISATEARMEELERTLAEEKLSLEKRFGRLEALIGSLNSQQAALQSLNPGGG